VKTTFQGSYLPGQIAALDDKNFLLASGFYDRDPVPSPSH